jgi:2-polyprenyl-3-methyl-5-hydroxy-6-metoxy-1,4-benzoquinol methylase
MTGENGSYAYIGHPRKVIAPLLKEKADTALDVGCGYGATLAWLKEEGWCKKTVGIELNAAAAAEARRHLDVVYQGKVEDVAPVIAPASIDMILCLDVLEHLYDPWATLRLLHGLLAPNGVLIASIPNAQHYSVSLPLLFKGEWRYAGSGLLDRSHLRFFTRHSAREMVEQAGFRIETFIDGGIPRRAALLTLNLLRPLFVVQYLLSARR